MTEPATYVDVLRMQAERFPDRAAFRFLLDGEREAGALTYAALDERARAVAGTLQARGLRGERALLLFEPGLDFVAAYFGCLYAGVVAVPVYPPRLNRTLERLQAIIHDAGARAVLTGDDVRAKLARPLEETPALRALQWITPSAGGEGEWADAGVRPCDVAFLQYTSGSTSRPKGVRVTHRNLLANQRMMRDAFGHAEGLVVAGWLPLYHDMGLIGNVLHPVLMGGTCVLMSPTAFLQRPVRWLEAVSRYGAETSGGPNFAYELCAERVTPEEREGLDLSAWRVAFCGAEPVRAHTLDRFARAFAGCGFRGDAFYPCYGLAEATLFVTGGRRDVPPLVRAFDAAGLEHDRGVEAEGAAPDAVALVGCGAAWGDSRVVVADPTWWTTCHEGEVGEVWVEGPHVARGYWNLPEATERTFEGYLRDTGEGPFLRTGDLGFVHRGELFVTGRRKDLVIIRGRNLYPQDLEATAEASHGALRPGGGAAFPVEVAGEERLVLVHEVRRTELRGLDAAEVTRRVREAVAEAHEVQVHEVVLIRPATLPKTSSGKVQRQACRRAYLAGELERVAPDASAGADASADPPSSATSPAPDAARVRATAEPADVEAFVAAHAASVLRIPRSAVRPEGSLAGLGLDSLSAVDLATKLSAELAVSIDPTELLGSSSVAELARALAGRLRASDASSGLPSSTLPTLDIGPAPVAGEALPLSFGQQALWFLHRMAPEGAAYNVAVAVTLRGEVDSARLSTALADVVDRHAALRAVLDADEPVQRVVDSARPALVVEDAEGWSDEALRGALAGEAFRPFDLSRGPLLRAVLYRRGRGENVLLLAAHHVVVDLRSLEIVADELFRGYEFGRSGAPASPAPTYADYVRWQGELVAGDEGSRLRDALAARLAGAPTVLSLPTDRPRPAAPSGLGGAVGFALPPALAERARRLARAEGVTPYVLLLATFQLLLHRLSGQDDLLVGSPTVGRAHPALAGVVGYLANPAVLRARFHRALTFRELLRAARHDVLAAMEAQAFPFERLVEHLQPARGAARSPLFQALFAYQQAERVRSAVACALGRAGEPERRGGLTLEAFALAQHGAQFDLSLAMGEVEGTFAGSFQFDADLFDRATVERMALRYERLMEGAVAAPDAAVALLPLARGGDEAPAVREANRTTVRLERGEALLHELVAEQAARTPAAVALVHESGTVTYAALLERAGRIEAALRGRGVGPEQPVGVCLERSPDLVAALLGTLRAGGAYVPLDPDYPAERLAYMAADSGVRVVLTHSALAERLSAGAFEALCVDRDLPAQAPTAAGPAPVLAENAAYVIYTSGSTGRPKGAVNTHRAVVNRLLWMQREYGLGPMDAVLQKTPFSFDVSVWELFWPLVTGARMVLARPGGHRDPAYLRSLIDREGVTTAHFVPSMLHAFLDSGAAEGCTALKRVVCSGEALGAELQERFFAALPGVALHNLYGPTEAAVDVTFWACEPGRRRASVPIGRPVANTRVFVMDGEMQPLPEGVPGELCIAGVQVGRGYHGRPGLTAERFVPDPASGEAGARMYRTGDRARWLPEGAVEYLGRTDFQVKVRGFRIEPGEVEAVLASHPAVRECVVAAVPAGAGEHRLAAWVAGDAPDPADLREFLRARLPDFMVPSAFVVLAAMPLSANGKVDRGALPPPDAGREAARAGYVAPRGAAEEALAAIWREVLGLERVGVRDDFFELGGYSLLGVKVASRVKQEFGVELPLPELFQSPTIESLARCIARLGLMQQGDDDLLALLAGLEDADADEGEIAASSLPVA